MNESHHRKLPHYYPAGVPIAVTFRTKDSLSRTLIEKIKREYDVELKMLGQISDKAEYDYSKSVLRRKYFLILDRLCVTENNSDIDLASVENLKILTSALLFYNAEQVDIFCFSVMRNHVHVLLSIRENRTDSAFSLPKFMLSVKGFTANRINKALNRSGRVWNREYYDSQMKSNEQFIKTILYILENPVKAGEVSDFRSWPGNYFDDSLISRYTGMKAEQIVEMYGCL
ncbi:MAG: transposase [Ignavibacteriaceae bacterium]|nr:transposase [Ignavibacteriaceae bacterium]